MRRERLLDILESLEHYTLTPTLMATGGRLQKHVNRREIDGFRSSRGSNRIN